MYDIKQYDVNPIGSATNILAGLDIQAIESIEVIKDPLALAKLGPLAANGAIWIVTKMDTMVVAMSLLMRLEELFLLLPK